MQEIIKKGQMIMRKIKGFLSTALAAVLLVTGSGTVFADSGIPVSDTPALNDVSRSDSVSESVKDCVANSIMVSETIEKFEAEYHISFGVRPQDITKEMININAEWIRDANQFLDSYISTSRSKGGKPAVPSPDSKQMAKAEAMMYSMDRAAFSLQRNPRLDFGKEVQYMFLSHYIDRNDYYWSTEDERLLLDGPSMSGEKGCLADWITSSDRRSYDSYMGYSGFNSGLQQLGNLAVDIYSYKGTPEDLTGGIEALKKADAALIAAYGMVLQDSAISVSEAMSEEVVPLFDQVRASLSQNPNVKLSEMYDRYMEDEGFMGSYDKPDKSAIVRTALALAGAFIIGGPAGAVTAAVGNIVAGALSFNIDTYTNFFNYAAWVALRYGYSGRYADRTWYYIMGEEA